MATSYSRASRLARALLAAITVAEAEPADDCGAKTAFERAHQGALDHG